MPSSALPTEARAGPGSPAQLFWVFSQLALAGFGGVLPIAEDRLVRKEGWVSAQDFLETLALAQVLPGPNICNMAIMLGDRFHGTRGALAALAGLLLPPLLPVMLLAFCIAHGPTPQSSLVRCGLWPWPRRD